MVEQARAPANARGAGAGNFSPSITRIMRSMPAEMPPAKSPLLNFGVMIFVDDALGGDVGERALEAVADLDAQMAVVLGDDQQRAVVDLLAADLPGFRDPDRKLLDALGLRRRHDQHRDLAALARLEILQGLRQRGDVAAGQRPGLIDHAPRQRRHRDVGRGGERPSTAAAQE